MKITIADQPSKKEEKEIRLKLVQNGDAAVELIALDKNGNDTFGANYLLKISEDGITITNKGEIK